MGRDQGVGVGVGGRWRRLDSLGLRRYVEIVGRMWAGFGERGSLGKDL